jgi:hypothetical protein
MLLDPGASLLLHLLDTVLQPTSGTAGAESRAPSFDVIEIVTIRFFPFNFYADLQG